MHRAGPQPAQPTKIRRGSYEEKSMKISKYMMEVEIDRNNYIWYNNYNRGYLLVNQSNQNLVRTLKHELREGSTTLQNPDFIETLLKRRILVEDGEKELKLTQNMKPFIEARMNLSLEEFNAPRITERISQIARYVRKLTVNWYGSAPMEITQQCKAFSDQIRRICLERDCVYDNTIQTDGYLVEPFTLKQITGAGINGIQCTLGVGTQLETLLLILEHKMIINLRINANGAGYHNSEAILTKIPEEYRQNVRIHYCNNFWQGEEQDLYQPYMNAFEMGYSYGNRFQCFEVEGTTAEYDELELGIYMKKFMDRCAHPNQFEDGLTMKEKALLDFHADQFWIGRKTKMENQRHRTWKMG